MTVTPLVALDEYERWRVKRVTLKTWAGEKSTLLNLCDHLTYLDLRIDQVTPEVLDDWWWDQKIRDSTRHTRVGQLRSFWGFCREIKRWTISDPTTVLYARKPMAEPRERLSVDELLSMLGTAWCPQHRIVLALASNLCLRASEIKRLRVADWWGSKLRVRVEKTREVDDMPVSSDLAAELRLWMGHYRAEHPTLARGDFLVPSQYVSNVNYRIHYRPAKGPIGDPEDVVHRALTTLGWDSTEGEGIHTVRRSVARIFYEAAVAESNGNDALLATMRLLHHSKPTTTLTYIGVDKQTEERDRLLADRPFLTRLATSAVLVEIPA